MPVPRTRNTLALTLLLFLSAAGPLVQAHDTGHRQVILVQNSGWMEPFFHDPDSPFLPLLNALGGALAIGGDVAIASFNQDGQIADRRSPHVLYRGPFTREVLPPALQMLDLPRRPDGHYADADFQGALTGAIRDLLGGRPGVIWMITNNKNAPGNDPRVQENTRAYFRQLSESDAISRLVAYPLRMPVRGRTYREDGLIIYGIGYGNAGGDLLQQLVERVDGFGLFTDPAVVLKPLDRIPLRFLPGRIHPPELTARWHRGGLVVEGIDGERPQELLIEGRLQSDFYPHVIERATLQAHWRTPGQSVVEAAVSPAELRDLQPLTDGSIVTVRMRIPALPRAPGLAGLRQDRVDLIGMLELELAGTRLRFSDEFSEKMQALYGLDQLPALFFDNRRVDAGQATIPVRLTAHYSLVPLLVTIGAAAIALLLLGGAFAWLRMPRTDSVRVGSVVRRITLCPLQTQELHDPATGARVQVTMGLSGKATTRAIEEAP